MKVTDSELEKLIPSNVGALGGPLQSNLEEGAGEQVQVHAERPIGVSLFLGSGSRTQKEQSRVVVYFDERVKFGPDFIGALLRRCHGCKQTGVAENCHTRVCPTIGLPLYSASWHRSCLFLDVPRPPRALKNLESGVKSRGIMPPCLVAWIWHKKRFP